MLVFETFTSLASPTTATVTAPFRKPTRRAKLKKVSARKRRLRLYYCFFERFFFLSFSFLLLLFLSFLFFFSFSLFFSFPLSSRRVRVTNGDALTDAQVVFSPSLRKPCLASRTRRFFAILVHDQAPGIHGSKGSDLFAVFTYSRDTFVRGLSYALRNGFLVRSDGDSRNSFSEIINFREHVDAIAFDEVRGTVRRAYFEYRQ